MQRLLSVFLTPFGWFYAGVGRLRFARTMPIKVSVPVICIGNITAGGTGKTPTALAVQEYLDEMGIESHFLTRGYGGSIKGVHAVQRQDSAQKVGDEAALLALRAPTWVSADRVAGAQAAIDAKAQAIIMDDGFQNPKLAKDLSIVIVDAVVGFGNQKLIPAGPLREPIARGLARADAVLVVGKGAFVPPADFKGAVFYAQLKPVFCGFSLMGAAVVAFAGIGRPEKFFQTLKSMGAILRATHSFPDHHRYDTRILQRLTHQAMLESALLVTTEKDAIKLPRAFQREITTIQVKLQFENPDAFKGFLHKKLNIKKTTYSESNIN